MSKQVTWGALAPACPPLMRDHVVEDFDTMGIELDHDDLMELSHTPESDTKGGFIRVIHVSSGKMVDLEADRHETN